MAKTKNIAGIFYLLLILHFFSCEEKLDWELSAGENGHLVVEAILTNEESFQSLRLSTSFNNLNQETPTISDAIVSVHSFSDEFSFVHVEGDPGLYQSEIPFACQKDVPYNLSIQWEDQIYEASASLSFVAPFQEIKFTNIADTDSFEIKEVAPLYHPLEQAFHQVNLDWTHIEPGDSSRALMYFYTFKTVDGSGIIRPAREKVVFPRGTILTEKKFGMDDGFAEFMRAMALETEWKGGLFDEASSSLPTNISNGGLGYFAVCGILGREVVVE